MRHAYAFSPAAIAALCIAAAACGGNVVHGTGAGTTSTGTGASTTGTGGSLPGGYCTTDADCPGGTCAPITPGGWRFCLVVPPEVTSCGSPMNPTDKCCSSADCKQGGCWSTGALPTCGGPATQLYNECMTDLCTTDAECVPGAGAPPEICAPAGTFNSPVRFCVTAYCHTDADCTAQPGGYCAPVIGPCCNFVPLGLGCVYPGGCREQADCGPGNSCALDSTTGAGTCMAGIGACPG